MTINIKDFYLMTPMKRYEYDADEALRILPNEA
jgi:hypothetical protein